MIEQIDEQIDRIDKIEQMGRQTHDGEIDRIY